MVGLNKAPGYGYENPSNPAAGHYRQAHQAVERYKQKGLNLPYSEEQIATFDTKRANITKFVGYFPIIGSFVGIGRLLSFAAKSTRRDYSYSNIVRGAFETASLGIVNLPVDLIVQGVRKYRDKQNKGTDSE